MTRTNNAFLVRLQCATSPIMPDLGLAPRLQIFRAFGAEEPRDLDSARLFRNPSFMARLPRNIGASETRRYPALP